MPLLGATVLALSACSKAPAPSPGSETQDQAPSSSAAASDTAASVKPPSLDPQIPSAATDMQPVSCSSEIGKAQADKLVQQCLVVSPATRPPCNAVNSCAMIRNEIARGCAILGEDAVKTPDCGGIDPVGRPAAADMVERYYAAINERDFPSAWALWGPDGGSSGQTLQAFTEGYAHTRRVHVDIGKVSDVEGGAGSLYVTVPVTVDAELDNGKRQRFVGSYALRQINRGMGVSQGWHITSASLRPA
ncbi:hypothetical protein A8V01_07265 [Novosphingobium guangzhouense]|uniref:Uncharacterized protein n=1 Tax=Novosphingobium guangzhouense TaxID=1850347 RepID=A0A2K2FW74_9SPHN|nr:hypothetical protein A8V01_07265 [Novosphingobium guangzhouense]